MDRTIIFVEQQFEYDHDEYLRWGAADGRTVRELLSVTGALGKTSEDSIANQARSVASGKNAGNQHYPEVCYARHLIDAVGYPKDGIVYENFWVSERQRSGAKDPTSLFAVGTKRLADIFTDEFFRRFDALCDRNHDQLEDGPIEGARLDLFAVNGDRRRAGFWEIKKYGRTGSRTEKVQKRQLLTLAFIQHLVTEERDRVLRDPPCAVDVALVAFVPAGRSIPQKTHSVSFNIA
jgi:hypothetical protein